jgi:hypothetical protein
MHDGLSWVLENQLLRSHTKIGVFWQRMHDGLSWVLENQLLRSHKKD